MMRILLAASTLCLSVGCFKLTPVGPLAGSFAPKPVPDMKGTAPVVAVPPQDVAAVPTVQEAPPPPRPAFLISPDEVNETNAVDAERKLTAEMDKDRREAKKMTPPPIVSHVKRSER